MTDYQSRIKLKEIIFGAVGDGNFPKFCILHFAFCIQIPAQLNLSAIALSLASTPSYCA